MNGTKREAQRALAGLVAEVAAGKVSSTATTLGELLTRWLDHVDGQLSPTTLREYRRLVTTLLAPDLGALPLRRVTTRRLDTYYVGLSRERHLSAASIRHVHAVPAIHDTRALLAAAESTTPTSARCCVCWRPPGRGAARSAGCDGRTSTPGDGTLCIRRSVASVAGGTVVKDTKTHAARRIAVDGETLEVLVSQRRRSEERARACRIEFDPDSYVFTSTADGSQPLHPDTVTNGFRRLCDRAGLAGIRLHDLPHLHATQLLAAGVPVRTVSGRLGHANAATTLNVYAHFLEASDRQAADVIAGLLEARHRQPGDASAEAEVRS